MTTSNCYIAFEFGLLNVAENPKFTPGVQYTWTDVYTRKKYELIIRESDIDEPKLSLVTQDEKAAVKTRKVIARHNKWFTKGWKMWLKKFMAKTEISLRELAEASGLNYSTLRYYASNAVEYMPEEPAKRVLDGAKKLAKKRRAKNDL